MDVLEFALQIVAMNDRIESLESLISTQDDLQKKYDNLQRLCRKHSEDMMNCVRMCIHRPDVEDALKTQGAFYEAIKQIDNEK